MLTVEMTEHLLGIRICGDYDALDKLYDAVFELADTESDPNLTEVEYNMRTRMLALCYDLRHAYQGDRGIEMIDNGMDEMRAEWSGVEVSSYKNLVYSVEVLFPEAMYEVIGLNWLIDRRQAKLLGKASVTSVDLWDPKVMLDPACARVRLYQALVMEAVRARTSPNTFSRIRKQVIEHYASVARMYTQWMDVLNSDWMDMTMKRREKGLSTMVRDIASYLRHQQYFEIKEDVDRFVEEHGAPLGNVSLNLEYPEEFDW